MTSHKKKVAVIGSGFGGLSAACYLAKDGYDVTIYEKNNSVGGRARKFEVNGFTFDMGPSWYLMPDVFERFFADMNHTITYKSKKLDPSYRIYFEDKSYVDVPSNKKEAAKLFESLEKNGADKFEKWLKKATYQYEIGMGEFVYKNYNSLFDFFNLKIMTQGLKMKIFQSLDSYAKSLFKNPKSRQILLYTTVFLGGSPKNTPAMYSLMSHVDFEQGVFWVEGGITRVVEEFVTVAKNLGVKFKFNTHITKVKSTTQNQVTHICDEKKCYSVDKVVVNGDYAYFEKNVLTKSQQTYDDEYWEKRTLAPSGYILYLGINKKIPKLKHHTLVFNDWENHFEAVFKDPQWPKDPSYYICTPSKSDNTIAPKGKENIFILVPIASKLKDTKTERKKMRNWVISHIESLTESFEKDICFEKEFTISDFTNDYNAFGGTALGLAHSLMQTAIFRPKNVSQKLSNLFYCGHYTVPGVGMPMVIISGKLVRDRVLESE